MEGLLLCSVLSVLLVNDADGWVTLIPGGTDGLLVGVWVSFHRGLTKVHIQLGFRRRIWLDFPGWVVTNIS